MIEISYFHYFTSKGVNPMTSFRLNLIFCLVALPVLLAIPAAASAQAIPNPVIYLKSTEPYEKDGKKFVKYHFAVYNQAAFPAAMFAAAPDLPPCGMNTKSSRTWVDLYDQRGKRIWGFCAFSKPADLEDVWFALDEGAPPASWIYIELTDRKTNTKYKSNLAETSN
jgi:hypothetical protein